MATGPEHYRQAEELLMHANTLDSDPDYVGWCQRQGQAHATLAQVAALIELMPGASRTAWIDVLGLAEEG